jgi:hypothetical protein
MGHWWGTCAVVPASLLGLLPLGGCGSSPRRIGVRQRQIIVTVGQGCPPTVQGFQDIQFGAIPLLTRWPRPIHKMD